MRVSIVVAIFLAGTAQCVAAGALEAYQFAALGLDNQRSIEWNLKAISSLVPTAGIDGFWSGSVGEFHVSVSGRLAEAPETISISTTSPHSRSEIERTFNLNASDAVISSCPLELLMDDGIGCDAVFYGCASATKQCALMVTTYSREETSDYAAIPGWVHLTWSEQGFKPPTP
jgi:hypothetical protein